MNREQIVTTFTDLLFDSAETNPTKIARTLCVDLGVPARAIPHASREIVRVMGEAARNGVKHETPLAHAVADWLLEFAAEAA